ncbi:choice-of-anchor Q domain-containing protein [uncultured Chloroflexus sp.]|uniref:choice-of-anchor Q domain-containing protein n=1 Tax=uncultured Chloroflexus sp. TaxID=214040 RepID=UPI0026370BE8|nr:choice-of-anchor Q domain-containing protein [uncultured Chloroflexus sp.]
MNNLSSPVHWLILLGLLLFWTATPVRAAGVVGNGTPASCTEAALRAAVANGGRVTFNCGPQPVTITLSSQLEVRQNTEIDGGGPQQGGRVTLSGGGRTRIIWLYDTTLTIRNLTLVDGRSVEGGAIRSAGLNAQVFIYNSIFRNNDSTAGTDEEGGGAISMHFGKLHIEDSLFENNRGINGGAIYNLRCPITVLRSTFRNNDSSRGGVVANFGFGGAIYNDGAGQSGVGGQIVIRDSIFIGNKARNFGGAVYSYLYHPDRSEIERSFFADNVVYLSSNNRASGGALMHHNGPLTLRDSTFVNNRSEDNGGAILIAQTTFYAGWNRSILANLTVVGNRADAPTADQGNGGGLYFNGGQATLINVTVAHNYADRLGGGIYNTSSNSADVELRNVIIASNQLGSSHDSMQCFGTFRGSRNLQSPEGRTCISGITKTDPRLETAVAYHGGSLPTLALLAGSPAIDAGADCPPLDQRGAARVGACDLGAFEYGGSAPAGQLDPPTLIGLASHNGGPLVQLSFAPVAGAVRYEVEARRDDGATWVLPVTDNRILLDQGRYTVRLRACSEIVCSAFGNGLSVEVTQAPVKLFVPFVRR